MNEGCNGGWPILGGYFHEVHGLPLESCARYMASTTELPCSTFSECEPVVKIKKSEYIGGYYGNSNELMMMKEIRARGPISGDLEVPSTFSFYTHGIFSEDHVIAL